MPQTETAKLRLSLGAIQLEYEGSETFLQTEVLKLVQSVDQLQVARIRSALNILDTTVAASINEQAAVQDAMEEIKSQLDSMSEMGEMESLRLQMAMDRLSKMMSTLSNLLKKISDTAESITQNLK